MLEKRKVWAQYEQPSHQDLNRIENKLEQQVSQLIQVPSIFETFKYDDFNDFVLNWWIQVQGQETTIIPQADGLEINGVQCLVSKKIIPYDQNSLYKVYIKLINPDQQSNVQVGIIGIRRNQSGEYEYVSIYGTNQQTQQYFVPMISQNGTEYIYQGYFKGYGTNYIPSNNPQNPQKIREEQEFIQLVLYVNSTQQVKIKIQHQEKLQDLIDYVVSRNILNNQIPKFSNELLEQSSIFDLQSEVLINKYTRIQQQLQLQTQNNVPPLIVNSSVKVNNLNQDLWDGIHFSQTTSNSFLIYNQQQGQIVQSGFNDNSFVKNFGIPQQYKSQTQPTSPQEGTLWFDETTRSLKVRIGNNWINVRSIFDYDVVFEYHVDVRTDMPDYWFRIQSDPQDPLGGWVPFQVGNYFDNQFGSYNVSIQQDTLIQQDLGLKGNLIIYNKDQILNQGNLEINNGNQYINNGDLQVNNGNVILQSGILKIYTTGTQPFEVLSNVKIDNLNQDLLDGYHQDVIQSQNSIVQRDSQGNIYQNSVFLNNITPTSENEQVSKRYVDSLIQGLIIKDSVRVQTTQPLSGVYYPQTYEFELQNTGQLFIDGILLNQNDRILLKDQQDKRQNGIYYVVRQGSQNEKQLLKRQQDQINMQQGLFVWVNEGNINGDTGWVIITNNPIYTDITEIEFQQFSSQQGILAGQGLEKIGNLIQIRNGGIITDMIQNSQVTNDKILSVDWQKITNKPQAYPPQYHEHTTSHITSGILPIVRGGTGQSQLDFTHGKFIIYDQQNNKMVSSNYDQNSFQPYNHTHTFDQIVTWEDVYQLIQQNFQDSNTIDFDFDDINNKVYQHVKPNTSIQKIQVYNQSELVGTRKQIRLYSLTPTLIDLDLQDSQQEDQVIIRFEHKTTDGTLHVPATGINNQNKVLKQGSQQGQIFWGWVHWDEIVGKPDLSSSDHNHDNQYLRLTGGTLTGKLEIAINNNEQQLKIYDQNNNQIYEILPETKEINSQIQTSKRISNSNQIDIVDQQSYVFDFERNNASKFKFIVNAQQNYLECLIQLNNLLINQSSQNVDIYFNRMNLQVSENVSCNINGNFEVSQQNKIKLLQLNGEVNFGNGTYTGNNLTQNVGNLYLNISQQFEQLQNNYNLRQFNNFTLNQDNRIQIQQQQLDIQQTQQQNVSQTIIQHNQQNKIILSSPIQELIIGHFLYSGNTITFNQDTISLSIQQQQQLSQNQINWEQQDTIEQNQQKIKINQQNFVQMIQSNQIQIQTQQFSLQQQNQTINQTDQINIASSTYSINQNQNIQQQAYDFLLTQQNNGTINQNNVLQIESQNKIQINQQTIETITDNIQIQQTNYQIDLEELNINQNNIIQTHQEIFKIQSPQNDLVLELNSINKTFQQLSQKQSFILNNEFTLLSPRIILNFDDLLQIINQDAPILTVNRNSETVNIQSPYQNGNIAIQQTLRIDNQQDEINSLQRVFDFQINNLGHISILNQQNNKLYIQLLQDSDRLIINDLQRIIQNAQVISINTDEIIINQQQKEINSNYILQITNTTKKQGYLYYGTDSDPDNLADILNYDGIFRQSKVYAQYFSNDVQEIRQFQEYVDQGYQQTIERDGLVKCKKNRQKNQYIVSDTQGIVVGKPEKDGYQVQIQGRVLQYVENKEKLKVGDQLCTTKKGILRKMKWWEKLLFPEQIVGYVDEIPTYEVWGKVKVNGRIWVRVK